jgi:hypothetical protein
VNTCIACGLRPPCRIPHWLDLVHRRLQRCDRSQRGGPYLLPQSFRADCFVDNADPRDSVAVLADWTVSPRRLFATAAIWLMALIHGRGVGPGTFVGNLLATLKIGALLLFVAFGFSLGMDRSTTCRRARVRWSPAPGSSP